MKRRAGELKPWARSRDMPRQAVAEWNARNRFIALVLYRICPFCGNDLPCIECKVPLYQYDGYHGAVPLTDEVKTRRRRRRRWRKR